MYKAFRRRLDGKMVGWLRVGPYTIQWRGIVQHSDINLEAQISAGRVLISLGGVPSSSIGRTSTP